MTIFRCLTPHALPIGLYRAVLSLLIFVSMVGIARADLNTGLIAKWGFDQCDATDDTGNGNNGVVEGPLCVNSGENRQAFDFDGLDDQITYFESGSLEPANFSLSFWFKHEGVPVDENLQSSLMEIDSITNPAGCTSNDFGVRYADSGVVYAFYKDDPNVNCSWTNIVADSPSEVGVWHHVVTTFDDASKEFRLFVDGEMATALVVGPESIQWTVDTSKRWRNGHRWADASYLRWFQGGIDEVRIYDRAVSIDEVKELYHLGLHLFADGYEGGTTPSP